MIFVGDNALLAVEPIDEQLDLAGASGVLGVAAVGDRGEARQVEGLCAAQPKPQHQPWAQEHGCVLCESEIMPDMSISICPHTNRHGD